MSKLFSNTTFCPTGNATSDAHRQSALNQDGYKPFCDSLTNDNSTAGTCSIGITLEVNTCGFATAAEGTAWCAIAANSQSSCCLTMTHNTLTTVSDSLLNTNNNVWIITGVSIGAAVILVICFFLYIRARGWKKKSTTAVEPIEKKPYEFEDNIPQKSGVKRFTQRLSRSMGALFKPKGRVDDLNNADYRKSKAGSYYNNNTKSNWDLETLPPMPNVTTVRKKTPGGSPGFAKANYDPQMSMMGNNEPPMSMIGGKVPKAPLSIITQMNSEMGDSMIQEPKYTFMKAVEEFFPCLDDEIQLQPGDMVQVVENYDDGWAVGKNMTSNEVGAFPMSCLVDANEIVDSSRRRS
ncbi:hypothetical protein HK096_007983, partial [Nowakowskiella sp. JEL0078]